MQGDPKRQLADPSFTCPRCGRTSHHPADAAQGYCGACHAWTGRVRLRLFIGGALADETWAGTDEEIAAAADRHFALSSAAADAGQRWGVEMFCTRVPESEAYARFGTDPDGMVRPVPVAAPLAALTVLGIDPGLTAATDGVAALLLDIPDAAECPGCGGPPLMRVSASQALCGNGDCPVFCWDPDASPDEFAASVHLIDLSGGTGADR